MRLFPHQVTERFIADCNLKGRPAMVYFHPWELDSEQRRLQVGLVKTFQHYVNLHSTEWKLNRLLQKFPFGSIGGSLESRRIQALLRRNPVYIPSHLDPEWDKERRGSDPRGVTPQSSAA